MPCCATSKRSYDLLITGCRRVGIDHLNTNGNAAARSDLIARCAEACQNRISASFIDVADINLQPNANWNAIDRTGENVAYAGCPNCIDRAAIPDSSFQRQGDFGSSAQGVSAIGHQDSACMAAFTFYPDAQTCRSGDGGNHAKRSAAL